MSPRYREKPWSLVARQMSSGATVYYYHWYDEHGRRQGPKSTGIGYRSKKDRAKAEKQANQYCADLFRAGRLGIRADGKTLDDFVQEQHFFDWHKSRYVRNLLARSSKDKPGITQNYIEDGAAVYENRIKPVHGGIAIDEISAADCEDLLFDWKAQGYAPKTINNYRSYYSTILGEAERLDVIELNPWRKVEGMKAESEHRGGLTIAEGKLLMAPDGVKDDPRHRVYYLATKLAFLTGLRIGEVCGLYTDDVKQVRRETASGELTVYYIDVRMQYHPKLRKRVAVKDKDARAVPITPEMFAELEPYLTGQDRYLFSLHPRQATPLTSNRLRDWFYRRCEAVGIEYGERNVSFHSARRFFNTLLRRRVSGDVLRKMTGHDSDEMTEHYTDYLPEDLATIAEAQSEVLKIDEK